MNKIVMDNIDKGCMPTLNKYIKEQLIGAIIKYAISKDSSYFTDEYNARNIINSLSPNDFKQALLEHVVKLDAIKPIQELRYLYDFSKDYASHSIGETELRLYETLEIAVDDVFYIGAVNDAYKIITYDQNALYNVVESFIEFRYIKGQRHELDTRYLEDDLHKQIIWKIEDYFRINNV